jgi:glycerate kinase
MNRGRPDSTGSVAELRGRYAPRVRVVIAPDKFKGTLDASEVAGALAEGWRRGDVAAEIDEVPVADGGDGTLEALVAGLGGEIHRATVTGPLGDRVEAVYGLVGTEGGLMGVVEMARASGLALLRESRRDPLRATTRGTGELILAACQHGPDRLMVCIGGSATNDAGAGVAQALGILLLDEEGEELAPGGAALERLTRIDMSGLHVAARDVEVVVASDVDNPLTGPHGASAIYGPQKGASPEDVAFLDRALGHFAAVVHRDLGIDVRDLPGAGAAGGLGAGLVAFLGARLRPGFDLVAEAVGLSSKIESCAVVVTGEGQYDSQSERGKAPAGVLRMAREARRRSALVAGQIEEGARPDADVVYSLAERAGLDEAMRRPRELLEEAGEEVARRFAGGPGGG